MNLNMRKFLFVFTLVLAFSLASQAQEEPKASKFENVSYHNIVKIDFKPGTYSRVQEIMKIYMAAGKSAGVKGPEVYWLMTGDYDVMFVWTMEGGTADLEWDWSPDDIKWWKALVADLGSEDKAKELRKEWGSFIVKSTNEIARKQLN